MKKIEESIIINRSPEEVFAFIDDRSNDPKWMESVLESEWVDSGETTELGRRGRFVMKAMGRREFTDEGPSTSLAGSWPTGSCPIRWCSTQDVLPSPTSLGRDAG